MPDQTCLSRHLLYASVHAYHPRSTAYSSAPPRWLAPPLEIDAPPIDFALVGRFAEGIVIAFRGTLPPLDLSPDGTRIVVPEFIQWPAIIGDVGNDLHALMRADAPAGARPALPGQVHPGFARSLDELWGRVAAEVDRLRGTDAAPRLYCTGHSKGGALANLAALSARRTWPAAIVKAATFGAARAGDAAFAQAYRAAGIDCRRYEVAEDLVPDLPPGGTAVGTRHAVALVTFPPPRSLLDRLRAIFVRDDRGVVPVPIAAHLPYREFGYDRHVYEPGGQPEWS
ncbi:MAG TPA: hypothetical protein VMS43_12895 [Allosphingosinicella sp.]|nr:hypothetical protein [Allosphingosinicella sp.]